MEPVYASRENCAICRLDDNGHDPEDWVAFAPWNLHLLCNDCYTTSVYGRLGPIFNPEDLYDDPLDDPLEADNETINAQDATSDTDSDDDLDPAYEMIPIIQEVAQHFVTVYNTYTESVFDDENPNTPSFAHSDSSSDVE